jgi:hypothetical protein
VLKMYSRASQPPALRVPTLTSSTETVPSSFPAASTATARVHDLIKNFRFDLPAERLLIPDRPAMSASRQNLNSSAHIDWTQLRRLAVQKLVEQK